MSPGDNGRSLVVVVLVLSLRLALAWVFFGFGVVSAGSKGSVNMFSSNVMVVMFSSFS